MRTYAYLILFALVLAAPFVLRLTIGLGQSPGTAPSGAALRLVIVTPHNQDIRREFAWAFDQWHREKYGQAVRIDYRTPGGTSDVKRLLDTTYRAARDPSGKLKGSFVPDIDMVWGGGDFFFDVELKPLGVLQPMALDRQLLEEVFPQKTLAGVKLYDYDPENPARGPQWVGVCLSSFGIVYNPDVYATLQLPPPTTWADLTNQKLAGFLALADPTHSGSAAVAYMTVIQRAMAGAQEEYFRTHPEASALSPAARQKDQTYNQAIAAGWKRGMSQLLLIAANARYFTDSASQVPNDVGNGEAAAGMAIDFYALVYQDAVGAQRCKYIAPQAATAITPDPVAILAGVSGQKLTLATRFVEFLLTPQAQRLWIVQAGFPGGGGPRYRSPRRPPIRPDVYTDRAGWPDIQNPFELAGAFNQRPEFNRLFSDTRPLWAAAWIDSREALKDAYAAILRVPDPAKRAALIAQLADLPVEMSDVAQVQQERQLGQQAGAAFDIERWKAQNRIRWGKKFRAHYAAVAALAQLRD